jgi:hypothetical protein
LVGCMLVYALRTRWYLFPLVQLNVFLAYRYWGVGSCNGLLVVLCLMLGVLVARAAAALGTLLGVLAVCLKLTPVFFLTNFFRFDPRARVGAALLLLAGFVLPLYVLENYRYIYGFHATRDIGPIVKALAALGMDTPWTRPLAAALGWVLPLLVGGAFSLVFLYAQLKLKFTWEDRLGWAAVPFSLLFSLRMLSMRTLFEAMAIPDARLVRSLWLFGMGLADMALRALDVRRIVRDGVWDVLGCLGLYLICRAWLQAIGAAEIRRDWGRRRELLLELFRAPTPAP